MLLNAAPLVGDAFEPPPSSQKFLNGAAGGALPGNNSTSEFMVGKIAVGVILPESNGGTENWDSDRQNTVFNQIVEGLDWWVTKGGPQAHLSFYYDQKFGVPTQYEPITMNGPNDAWQWVGDIFQNMGYPGSDQFSQARAYINDIRADFATDWCMAIIVVDSLNDSDGIFGNGMYFAWSNLGGPYFVMSYDNDGYGIDNMHLVARHETGHIFLAGDEYCQPGYYCCGFNSFGYLWVPNGNCESGNPSSVPCIMRYNEDAVCHYTAGQIGWRDTDGDGKADTIDNVVSNTLNSHPTPTNEQMLTFTGSAADIPYNSPTRPDVTINRISSVKYQIDGSPWMEADAVDGAFDADVESYTFTTPPLGAGVHRISTRAWSTSGNGSQLQSQDVDVQIPFNSQACRPVPTEYARHVSLSPTLAWQPGYWAQDHAVYFGLDQNSVNNANPGNPLGVYMGRQDSDNYTPAGPLYLGETYYWRIDEYNDTNVDSPWKGPVWQFTTVGPEANEPKPLSGAVGLGVPIQLGWKPGAWAVQHDVYFGTSSVDVLDANITIPLGVYKGRQSSNTYSLGNLDYNLTADTDYYWRIDEVNDSNTSSPWKGDIWEFRNVDYFVVDDFNYYSDNNQLRQKWHTDSIDPACSINGGGAGITLSSGMMEFAYDNNGTVAGNDYFSEVRFDANDADWTGGNALPDNDKIRSIAISYIGGPANDADPVYDRLYAGVEDTAGNFSMIIHPEPNAQTKDIWRKWNILLSEMNSTPVNMAAIRYFYIGSGIRCNGYSPGGVGTVTFEDIRLYQRHCVPEFGPAADLTADCVVGPADIKVMGQQWLTNGEEADFSGNGIVDFKDFAVLAKQWLNEKLWPNP
jgi:hypothetical protein